VGGQGDRGRGRRRGFVDMGGWGVSVGGGEGGVGYGVWGVGRGQ